MRAPASTRENLVGSLWMICAMAAFAVEDGFIKQASQSLGTGDILIYFGLGGSIFFLILSTIYKIPLKSKDSLSRPMKIRVLLEIIGRLFYALALAYIPLSTATVILQATPLVVVASAAVIFGETVGWRRWTAIIVGLSGVLIIVQPGGDGFSALSLLAVIGMLGFAGRDLASRAAPASVSTVTLGLYGFAAIVVAGGILLIWTGAPLSLPTRQAALPLIGAIVFGVAAYSCLMRAMRIGDVSAVTPLRYTRLVFGVGLGVVMFGENLTTAMIAGSALIVASGAFILLKSPTRAQG